MRNLCAILLLLIFASCFNSSKPKNNSITLFVAASLTDVMEEMIDTFRIDNNIEVKISYASSGTLAKQITMGANCDYFISANKAWMDYVSSKRLLLDSSICQPISNSLALIYPNSKNVNKFELNQLAEKIKGRLAIGNPEHVPAGQYAVEAIKNLGIYKNVEKLLIPAKDVRSALTLVELGECSWGIVYKTEAIKSAKVAIHTVIPDSLHTPIRYHASLTNIGKDNDEAKKIATFLKGTKAVSIWNKHGFNIVK